MLYAPFRGLTNDRENVAAANRRTAQQKVSMLELMLGQVANYCPVISRNTIVKNSTSIQNIWQTIRLHYGFKSTGAHFLDLADIRLDAEERPEDLYQGLIAFVEDTMLKQGGGITHHDANVDEDEEVTPTLENMIVLVWLQLIHKDLPKLVKQRYGTELRSRTLASIKPEISQALDTLLEEIRTGEDTKILRATTSQFRRERRPFSAPKGRGHHHHVTKAQQTYSKQCPLCKQAGRPEYKHYLSECSYLPESDRKFIARARQISNIFESGVYEDELDSFSDEPLEEGVAQTALRIQVRQSPYLDVFHNYHPLRLTIDSGATGNMIRGSVAHRIGATIKKTSQSAQQADGSSPLNVVGETKLCLICEDHEFTLDALVIENLDVEVLAGTPFMEQNDIAIRPAKHEISFRDGSSYIYGSKRTSQPSHRVRRTQVLRAQASSVAGRVHRAQHTTRVRPGGKRHY